MTDPKWTVEEFAKKFDLACLTQDARKDDVRQACETAIEYQVASVNVNSYWLEYAASILDGSGVGHSSVIGFPFGACFPEVKYLEIERSVDLGASACDMVVNIGAVKDGDLALVRKEIERFVELTGPGCLTKLIFEVGFLTDDEIATLTQICCEAGVDYVKTATGTQAFPDLGHVETMRRNLSGSTKIKVSGVPRTFTLPAVVYMFEHLGVGLVGTRSAGKLVEQYRGLVKGAAA